MEEKTKISLLYMLIGGLLGAVSAFLSVLGISNYIVLALYIGVVYAATYGYSVVGVKFEKLGEKRWRSALNGVWPSLLPWLVIWTMAFYIISPVIILADTSDAEAAEDLSEYLEAHGVTVKITDDYTRHIFAHKVVIFGSRVPIPLGTSYGITAFPDAIQRLLRLEKDKGTINTEEVNAGEIMSIKKTARLIIIIAGQKDERAQTVQENRDRIYQLLTQ